MKITIPDDCEHISVLFSGGVDSTLLLFLLMQERNLTPKNIPIKCYKMKTGRPQSGLSGTTHLKVLKWITEYFKEEIPIQTISSVYIRDSVANILLLDSGYVYSGCNLVLHNEFTPTVYVPGDTPPVRGPALNEFHLRPFIELPKDVIIKEYEQLGILELLKLTVSCAVADIPCGGCYFCLEREWGIKKAGIPI